LKRLNEAAEKIEQAAALSGNAGKKIQETALYIESEVRDSIPSYTELFQEITEFQQTLSAEMKQLRQDGSHQKRETRLSPIDAHGLNRMTIDARSLFQ
jgi:hypothetical protein